MNTGDMNREPSGAAGTPLSADFASAPPAQQPPGLATLSEEVRKLVAKLDTPKRKDIWDVIGVLTTFAGTVLMAGVSLFLTQSFQKAEAERTHAYQKLEAERAAQFHESQIGVQRSQVRVEELKAIAALAPLLASGDPAARATGKQLLEAVRETGGSDHATAVPGRPAAPGAPVPAVSSTQLLDRFADIALSATAAPQERIEATRKIGEIAIARDNSAALRERAADVAARVATSSDAPPEVRQAAADVIAKIKRIGAVEVKQLISTEPVSRKISDVILHSSATPAAAYKGATTLFGFARMQLESLGWSAVSWHYAIAPDGDIWLGAPLNAKAIHTPQHNDTSVSVMLIMDGDKELPTEAQRSSLVLVLNTLFARFNVDSDPARAETGGFHFHRDYVANKSCPGTLLTREMVLGWTGPRK